MTRLIILALLLVVGHTQAKEAFEGSITYHVSTTDQSTSTQDLPQKITSYHKEGKMSLNIPIKGVTFTIISNINTDEVAFIVNTNGLKLALKTNKGDLSSEVQDEVSSTRIEHTKYHKHIAGIKCHKAIVHNKGDRSTIYIADQLNAEGIAWLFDQTLNGTLLEFQKTDPKDGDEIHIYATKVNASPVNDHIFELPADYITIEVSELSEMFKNGLFQ